MKEWDLDYIENLINNAKGSKKRDTKPKKKSFGYQVLGFGSGFSALGDVFLTHL